MEGPEKVYKIFPNIFVKFSYSFRNNEDFYENCNSSYPKLMFS